MEEYFNWSAGSTMFPSNFLNHLVHVVYSSCVVKPTNKRQKTEKDVITRQKMKRRQKISNAMHVKNQITFQTFSRYLPLTVTKILSSQTKSAIHMVSLVFQKTNRIQQRILGFLRFSCVLPQYGDVFQQ
ncbi:Hypothetical_protein [Hexamita inflata]|uniref:Hypothetical_protein n=1 Tax=Hexamita inflata TaxID=28002 RepID=A0ABP1GJC8_9EUKA